MTADVVGFHKISKRAFLQKCAGIRQPPQVSTLRKSGSIRLPQAHARKSSRTRLYPYHDVVICCAFGGYLFRHTQNAYLLPSRVASNTDYRSYGQRKDMESVISRVPSAITCIPVHLPTLPQQEFGVPRVAWSVTSHERSG